MCVRPFILLKQMFYSKVVVLLLERLPETRPLPRTFHLTDVEAAGPVFGLEAAHCRYFLHWGKQAPALFLRYLKGTITKPKRGVCVWGGWRGGEREKAFHRLSWAN